MSPTLPSYLGAPIDFAGTNVPGFYNINIRDFPFYRLRNQLQGGLYTPGRPTFVNYDDNNPQAMAGIMMPGGRQLYTIRDEGTGWPRDPLSQELMRRSYTQATRGGRGINTDPNFYETPREYNQAMRRYARREAAADRPLMAFYDPRFSVPRRPGLLAT